LDVVAIQVKLMSPTSAVYSISLFERLEAISAPLLNQIGNG
jgi:hypothetical protein